MKKHAGNFISWSSVIIVIFAIATLNAFYVLIAVFIAAIMDMFDGKLARKYGDNSRYSCIFGELTDSLCDSSNFGFVPGIILPLLVGYEYSFITILCGSLFVIAGIYRLARFSANKDGDITEYQGLPITVAGPVLALVTVAVQNEFITIIVSFILALLMVSNLRVKKLKI